MRHVAWRPYIRGAHDHSVFTRNVRLSADKTEKLGELISELVSSQTEVWCQGVTFVGMPPYYTVENVTHIYEHTLTRLLEIDREFVWDDYLTFSTSAEYPSTPVWGLMSDSSSIGPVFSRKDHCAFVKLSKTKGRPRAVIKLITNRFVKYTNEPVDARDKHMNSYPSVFVTLFCTELYGTRQEDYKEAVLGIASRGRERFLVEIQKSGT
ncbi:hypothetical protein CRENBAI_010568 [Crenichthys baileyi]|uniref:Uncharacterized protein n=1 Tax=Crenichthys baileyi TaxID=28760 RepID=A0AAV9SCN3_9TELE